MAAQGHETKHGRGQSGQKSKQSGFEHQFTQGESHGHCHFV